jgi:dienelactone hydrolase
MSEHPVSKQPSLGSCRRPLPQRLSALVLVGSFLLWATRRGFITTWVASFAALALLITPAARAGEVSAASSRIVPSASVLDRNTRPSEPVQGLLPLAAIAVVGLVAVQPLRSAKGKGRRGHRAATALVALAALALLGAPAFADGDKASPEPKSEVQHFRSGCKKIKVECFSPAAAGKHPALILLPAVDGIDGDNAAMYRTIATSYARKGYVVLLVHYFDRTGAAKTDVEGYRKLFVPYFQQKVHKDEEVKKIQALLGKWARVVRDAVAYARGRDDVDGKRVGLAGFSLGGTVALAAATQHDLKLAALVECFGTLPHEMRPGVTKLPATLILHGEEDDVVPPEEAYILIGLMSLNRLPYEAEVYKRVGHMFFLGKVFQWKAVAQANERVTEFLRVNLKEPKAIAALNSPETAPRSSAASTAR